MMMTPSIRRLALTFHVTASVGWVGALAVFFAHALAGLVSQDEQVVRAVSIAMGITAWFVILPLSLTSFATGLSQALGTAWGLLRHYWILFKLLLTIVATIVLLLKLGPISYLADAAADTAVSNTDLIGLRTSVMLHAGGGLVVLLVIDALAIYKPRGITPYGLRKQRQPDDAATEVMDTPRWVKIFGMMFIILTLMVAVMLLAGGHGPGAHLPFNA
jgi:predicted secreted protein